MSTQPGGKLTVSGTIEGDGIRLVGLVSPERGIHLGVGGTVISAETNTQKVGINESVSIVPTGSQGPKQELVGQLQDESAWKHWSQSTDLIVDETS